MRIFKNKQELMDFTRGCILLARETLYEDGKAPDDEVIAIATSFMRTNLEETISDTVTNEIIKLGKKWDPPSR